MDDRQAKLRAAMAEDRTARIARADDEEVGIYWIRRGNLAAFDAKLELVNRRARKLGIEEMSYLTLATVLLPRIAYCGDSPSHVAGTEEWAVILPSDVQVKLAGWEFCATVVHASEYNLILSVPGASDLSEAMSLRVREEKPVCDHCSTRRMRKETFVVRHEDGREKLVGRQCLRDYLGHQNADALAKFFDAYANLLGDKDERWDEGGGFRRDDEGIATQRFLAFVSKSVRSFGWCPRSRASDGGATADLATNALYKIDFGMWDKNSTEADREKYRQEREPEAEDAELAEKVVVWVRDEMEIRSDFDHNLKAMATADIAHSKGLGIAAYAVVAYNKAMERETELRRQEEGMPAYKAEYLAEVGTRVRDIPAQVVFLFSTDGVYGPRTLVRMITDDGVIVTWWASNGCPRTKDGTKVDVGSKILMTGTVKKHEVYKEKFQTVVSRAILLDREKVSC